MSLLACAQMLWAQTAKYEGQPISDIQYLPAEQPLTAAELANAVPFKKGALLRLADVHLAIERLYATGAFDCARWRRAGANYHQE
jgi:outer membrane protein assembly factor BamA